MKRVIGRLSHCLVIATGLACAGLALAQESAAPPPATAPEAEAKAAPMGTGDVVTINVDDGELDQVLNAFSRQTGRNLAIGPDVAGKVTVRLSEVPWEQALDVILAPHGFTYELTNQTILVHRAVAPQPQVVIEEPLVSRVFTLKYLNGSDVKEIVQSRLSARGRISVLSSRGLKGWEFESLDASGNEGASAIGRRRKRIDPGESPGGKTIVVTDVEAAIEDVARILAEIDRIPVQVLIEAKFVEVSADRLHDLGVEFGTGAQGAQNAGVQPVLARGGGKVFGIGGQQISGTVIPPNFTPPNASLASTHPFNAGMSLMFQQLSDIQYQVLLHALAQDYTANVLSAPRVLVLDQQEAAIIVGTKFPIIRSEVSGLNASTSTTLEYYENIGIQLNVVPQICADGLVSLIVHPAVTDQIGTAAARTGSGSDVPLTEYPILSTREAETQILVKSGQTVVIGGLLQDQTGKTVMKVPVLGSIPLLGAAFRRETRNKSKIDLLIFLTATIRSADAPPDALPADPPPDPLGEAMSPGTSR